MPTMALCKRWQFISPPIEVGEFLLILVKIRKIKIIIITVIDKIESIMYNTDIHKKATKY